MTSVNAAHRHWLHRWLLPVTAFALAAFAGLAWASTQTHSVPPPTPTPQTDEFLASGYAELAREAAGTSTEAPLWELLSALLVPTVVVIVAAYATLRMLRSFNRQVAASISQSRLLELVDTLSLVGSGVVHIVRVGERYLLVGAGSGGLSLLGELRPEEIALLTSQQSSSYLAASVVPTFREMLRMRMPRAWRALEASRATDLEPLRQSSERSLTEESVAKGA